MNSDTDQDIGALAVALRRISHALNRHSRRQKVLVGLTAPQMLTLAALSSCEQPPSVTQLSQLLSLSQATTTDITLRLAAAGLVSRSRDPADGRRTVVRLTRQGSRALQTAASTMPEAFVQQYEALSAGRRRRLLGAVLDLATMLSDPPIPDAEKPCVDSTEKSVSMDSNPPQNATRKSAKR